MKIYVKRSFTYMDGNKDCSQEAGTFSVPGQISEHTASALLATGLVSVVQEVKKVAPENKVVASPENKAIDAPETKAVEAKPKKRGRKAK